MVGSWRIWYICVPYLPCSCCHWCRLRGTKGKLSRLRFCNFQLLMFSKQDEELSERLLWAVCIPYVLIGPVILSPWCNHNGWQDVKHHITYFDASLLWFICKCIIIVEIVAWLYEWGMSCCFWNNMILWWCWWMFLWCCLFFLEHISIGSKFRHSSNKLNYAGELCPFCSLLPPLVCWPGLEQNDNVLVWIKSCFWPIQHLL